MSTALKIIGGTIVVIGGIYVLCKTSAAKKLCKKISQESGKVKDSFSKGYNEMVEAG